MKIIKLDIGELYVNNLADSAGLAERLDSVYLNEGIIKIAKRLLECLVQTRNKIEKLEGRDYNFKFTGVNSHVRVRGSIEIEYETQR